MKMKVAVTRRQSDEQVVEQQRAAVNQTFIPPSILLVSLLKFVPILTVTPKPVDDECIMARWKSFKGCLGALNGTYINVQTPLLDKS
ncbi:hypothetical protein BUALT_Bualt07G0042700 [Buddleja alternifolia]|uniref:Uncharacterized protein n=1 Tax=Buddleja alternifolia TaxID=168488 RepID=A0AAV6X9E8_9LAMI|nr:hypothetical protein BUALT_Bualt07G0042700 [Buddleja alternifolia]